MRRAVVVGGSIAGVTAAGALRAGGYTGSLTLLSQESHPYSRVPLSKGVLAGTHHPDTAALPGLPDDVDLVRGATASGLDTVARVVTLADGTQVPYDGLVVATGSRARRLAAPGQRGELVIRTLEDSAAISARMGGARSAVVVGASFLGMEVASTLRAHGLSVTVVDRDPPLRRLLGPWLSDLVVATAAAAGVSFVRAEGDVSLVGDPVSGVDVAGTLHQADLVVSAVGDVPNVEWLAGSGLRVDGGLVVDDRCVAAPGIVGAGDVVARETAPGVCRRTPHWSNAVAQGRCAAASLLDPASPPYEPDHYFWTEQFGLDVKMAGQFPLAGEPEVLAGEPASGSTLVRWQRDGVPVAAASVNHRIPVARLKRLAHPA